MFCRFAIALGLTLGTVSSSLGSSITIDSFSGIGALGPGFLSDGIVDGTNPSDFTVSDGPFTDRELGTTIAGPGTGEVTGGLLKVDDGTTSFIDVVYDGAPLAPGANDNGLSIDLVSGVNGHWRFQIDVASITGGLTVAILAVDDASSASSSIGDTALSVGENFIGFTVQPGFAPFLSGTADFADINRITFTFKGVGEIDQISVTNPEPASLAVFAGLAGLGLVARRRRA